LRYWQTGKDRLGKKNPPQGRVEAENPGQIEPNYIDTNEIRPPEKKNYLDEALRAKAIPVKKGGDISQRLAI